MKEHEIETKPLASGHGLGFLYKMLGGALVVWLAFWAAIVHFIPSDATARGQFGDMFGAINALFSAFAFAALVYTVFLQRQELELQRIELKDTRQELQRSAQAQEESRKAFEQQVALMSRDSFLHAYQIVYEQLCASCASLLRAHKPNDVWGKMWESYQRGYRDIFPNSLKNVVLSEPGGFIDHHLSFFQDVKSLERYCFRFEAFMADAERADPNGSLRMTLESSGLGSAYVALCGSLSRPIACKYRMAADDARLDRMNEFGMPKLNPPADAV